MRKGRSSGVRVVAAAVFAGLLVSSSAILAASYAAFSATTSNAANNWSVGSVVLADDDTGSAMFTTGTAGTGQTATAGLKPGQVVTNCVKVTYTGSLASTVKLYGTSISETLGTSTGLLGYLHLKIEEGTAGAFGCAGFAGATTIWDSSTHAGVASDLLSVLPITYATGPSSALGSWTTNSFRVYKFTITVDASAPDTSQGATATATFNWQAQNS
jgi:hypothetical protein